MPSNIRTSQLTKSLGVTGLSIWRGILAEEYLPALKGTKAYKIYQEMENDTTIATLLDALKMPLLAAEFSVVAASEDSKDQDIADFVWECMNDMSRYTWRQHVLDCLTMLVYGWSMSEIIMRKRDDGKLGIDILDPRDQNTLYEWVMDDRGYVEMMKQLDPMTGTICDLPAWKLVHMTFRPSKRNPEGTSPMRSLYTSWYMRKNEEIIEAIGIERDMAGIPVLKLPYGANNEAKEAAIQVVKNLRNDEEAGVVLPPPPSADPQAQKWELSLLSSGGKAYNARETIRDYNKQILMRFFAQFLALGMEQAGTQALVKGSHDFFSLALKSIQQEMLDNWNNQLVPLLVKVNNLESPNGYPLIDWADPGKTDLVGLSQLLVSLTGVNIITPDDAIEDQVRALAGLPDREEEEKAKEMRKHRRVFVGEGSGNWGHAGRPGEVGGSAHGGGLGSIGKVGPVGKEWAESLSKPEHKSIKYWTEQDGNRAIREAQRKGIETKQTRDFDSALNKDGSYQGETYRGIQNLSQKDVDSIINSETITLDAHSSSSKSKAIAEKFVGDRSERAVLFKVEGKTGVDLSSIPSEAWGDEEEVILKKGTTYNVGKVEKVVKERPHPYLPDETIKQTIYLVQLKEG